MRIYTLVAFSLLSTEQFVRHNWRGCLIIGGRRRIRKKKKYSYGKNKMWLDYVGVYFPPYGVSSSKFDVIRAESSVLL